MNRGNKLWEGHRIILPQHRDLLFDSRQKERKYRPPELAEDEMEEISRLIAWSKTQEKPITLIYAEKYGPRRITGVIDQAGLIHASAHSLRHSFCRNLINAGQPLQIVAQLAGHENLETTRRYITPSERDLRKAVEAISEEKEKPW